MSLYNEVRKWKCVFRWSSLRIASGSRSDPTDPTPVPANAQGKLGNHNILGTSVNAAGRSLALSLDSCCSVSLVSMCQPCTGSHHYMAAASVLVIGSAHFCLSGRCKVKLNCNRSYGHSCQVEQWEKQCLYDACCSMISMANSFWRKTPSCNQSPSRPRLAFSNI